MNTKTLENGKIQCTFKGVNFIVDSLDDAILIGWALGSINQNQKGEAK